MSPFFPTRRAPLFLLLLVFLVTSSVALAGDKSGDEPGYLGVFLQDLEPSMAKALQLDDQAGVLISEIAEDSPAEEAGLEDGDVILVFNGTETENAKALTRAVRQSNAGDDVKVIVLRDGKKKTIKVELGEREDDPVVWHAKRIKELRNFPGRELAFFGEERGFLGIHLDDLNPQLGEYFGVKDGEGVLVTEIVEDSPAAEAGLKAGDVITRIDGEKVTSTEELHEALAGTEAEQKVKVELRRKGDKKEFKVTLGESPKNKLITHLELLGEDSHFNVKSPKLKMHMAPHFKYMKDRDDFDEDVMFFRSGSEDDLEELREELKAMKLELKKIQEELKK